MKKMYALVTILVVLLISCTNEKNTIGNPDNNIQVTGTENDITDVDFYSYADTTDNYNKGSLLLGKYRDIESRVLIQFPDVPTSVYDITTDVIVTLYVEDDKELLIENIRAGIVDSSWIEHEATWYNADDDNEWATEGGSFTNLLLDNDNFSYQGDSIKIVIPDSVITKWTDDDLNNGFIFYTESETDGYFQLASRLSVKVPYMSFNYKETETDTTTYEYNENVLKDIFISDFSGEIDSNSLTFSNIPPTKMVLKFDIPDEFFRDQNGVFLEEDLINKITINKAELKMKVSTENVLFIEDSTLYFDVLILTDSVDFSEHKPLTSDNYSAWGLYSYSQVSEDSLEVSIDLTSVIQAYTSENYENYGFIIRSKHENTDYSNITFETPSENNPFKLKLIYTIPELIE